jgi:hypothetical protein
MELYRTLGLFELCPVKKRCTKLDRCSIQTQELVLEAKLAFARIQPLALAEELVKNPLIELPWAMFIGIGQG